jgi:hypothetical protein
MWDEMPEILRLRALLLVDDTDKFIEAYNNLTCESFGNLATIGPCLTSLLSAQRRVFVAVGMPGLFATTHRSERPARKESHRSCRSSGSRDLPDASVL